MKSRFINTIFDVPQNIVGMALAKREHIGHFFENTFNRNIVSGNITVESIFVPKLGIGKISDNHFKFNNYE